MTEKQRLIVAKAFMEDPETLAGGINEEKEQYYMKKYNATLEEIANIEVCVYAIACGAEVDLIR